MPRYSILVEYDGTGFVGWQRQSNGPSVQQHLEEALEALVGSEIRLFGAGRTDAGVHALGQVAHFDLPAPYELDTIRDAVNFHLKPAKISVLAARNVHEDFHARFDAVERRYKYLINDRRAPLTVGRDFEWHVPVKLDAELMDEGARQLVGTHDFTTFRAAECQAKSPIKTLTEIGVHRENDRIQIDVRAPSFLHHQVRSIAGSLKLVGERKWEPDAIGKALRAKDRSACGPVAPARGLYLVSVSYKTDGPTHFPVTD